MTALPAGARRQVKPYALHSTLTMFGGTREVGETHWKGWLLGLDTSGLIVPVTETPGLVGIGYANKDETVAGDGTLEGNADCFPDSVLMSTVAGDTFLQTDAPCVAYGVDNQTVGKLAVGAAQRSAIGVFLGLDPLDSTRAMVWLGIHACAVAKAMLGSSSTQIKVPRAVVTSLSASYTGTETGTLVGPANTAFPTQDAVSTLAVGDEVFIPEGTANLQNASDAGPWAIESLGSSSSQWELVRPGWYRTGTPIGLATDIKIGPEGATYGGTVWRSFAAPGKIVDTDAPLFWPQRVAVSTTLGAGGVSPAITSIPIRSATKSGFKFTPATLSGETTATAWRPTNITVGALGTTTFKVTAEATVGSADTGARTVGVAEWTNW